MLSLFSRCLLTDLPYGPIPHSHQTGSLRLLALHRDRGASRKCWRTRSGRIQSGQNIYDQAAAPLKPGQSGRRGYPDYKSARGLQPIRDWTWSGHTLRCLKVLTANENRAAIGFLDEAFPGRRLTASQIAAFNNGREMQWGVSPRDREVVLTAFLARPYVMLKAA